MSIRARWIALGVVLLVVLGLAAPFWFNTDLTMPKNVQRDDGPRTWLIEPGQMLTLAADEVHPSDRYRCAGEESGVEFTPVPGTESYSQVGGISVRNAEGTVTAYCPPGNV